MVAVTTGHIIPNVYDNSLDTIPPHEDYPRMARYVVHTSNWTSMGSLSTLENIKGFPMVNVISIADSPLNEPSTGRIYFFLTMLDFTAQDVSRDNRVTLMFSLDQDGSCSKNGIDPMEPTCARVMISGSVTKVKI